MIVCDLFQTGFTHLKRQETTTALARGAREFAKEIDKIAKITWRYRRNLGALCGLAVIECKRKISICLE
jgi:hypothetical protein